MDDLPELPPKFQSAFETAMATAELVYVNRAQDFPLHPHLAESRLHQLIRIQAVFFAYCDQARNACREGVWTVAQLSRSVETARPIIFDFYFLREYEASSDEAKSVFRLGVWRTVQDDPRWKQHLSEVKALAATYAASAGHALTARPDGHPASGTAEGTTRRPPRHEIEKFAKGRFALVRDDILAEYEKQKTQVMRQVGETHNIGGYVPAIISWGTRRVRAIVLALADAYVDECVRYDVPSDKRAEDDLQATARLSAAGTIAGIRGELSLRARRTRRPLQNPGGSLNREISRSMKSAIDEGLLNMKQRIKSNGSKGTGHQAVGSSPASSSSEQSKSGHSDFLERLSKDDPNYEVARRFHLESWAHSYGLNARAFAGRASLSDYVKGCVRTFNHAARTQVAIQDAATIPERCREFDVMVDESTRLFRESLTPESRRLGKAEVATAIDEYSRQVNEIAARSKQRILKKALTCPLAIGKRANARSKWLDRNRSAKEWTADTEMSANGGPTYNTIQRYRSGKTSTRDEYVRQKLATTFGCKIQQVPTYQFALSGQKVLKFPEIS
jgi:hypothetical protein